ncbi:hypothetical protein [Vibrio marisflavi]|uniref:Uncharacterized protein n=1 Tax=Vibrio marisflavi CECT 7928 TaxID=634439 RepID=A0ABN8E5V9_9VIBR|nr:hypothetical protein [Vibrio marisflavi]CAH0539098.1 hypothetical protein VMF7928_01896 [Vibrio marisflavi CECT 7928]
MSGDQGKLTINALRKLGESDDQYVVEELNQYTNQFYRLLFASSILPLTFFVQWWGK